MNKLGWSVAAVVGVAAALCAGGCKQGGSSLRARSAGDLKCPAETLKIYRLDELSYRVVGCGEEAVYVSVCDGPASNSIGRACTWVMNTSRERAKAAPVSAAATGCSYDAQCKGERLCVNQRCVFPPVPAATPVPAASPAPSPSAAIQQ